jgi:hypothetical protein
MRMSLSENLDFDRRSRLVSLVYEVLRDMKTPENATDSERLYLLSQAFSDRATAPAIPEPLPPKGSKAKQTLMYSLA